MSLSFVTFLWFLIGLLALIIPAAYHATHHKHPEGIPDPDDDSTTGLLIISRGTSIILLLIYVAYLYFQLRSHADLYAADEADDEEGGNKMNLPAAGVSYVVDLV